MKKHYSTAESARATVDPYLRAWELSAGLFGDATDRFEFSFQYASIIDRSPTPGTPDASVGVMVGESHASADAIAFHGRYPNPPVGLAFDDYVELMLHRYRLYREGRTLLGDASNWCLTVLELAAKNTSSAQQESRKAAAKHFGISDKVLIKLGQLAEQKGGKEQARKAKGARMPFTAEERVWLETALQQIIRRAAEVAYDPNADRIQIKITDLPPL